MLFYCILRYIAIQQSAVCYTVCEVNSVYKRIRELREDADLTQKEVSKILHCSQQVYSNYELGQRDIPTAVLICLAKLYFGADWQQRLTELYAQLNRQAIRPEDVLRDFYDISLLHFAVFVNIYTDKILFLFKQRSYLRWIKFFKVIINSYLRFIGHLCK